MKAQCFVKMVQHKIPGIMRAYDFNAFLLCNTAEILIGNFSTGGLCLVIAHAFKPFKSLAYFFRSIHMLADSIQLNA